MSEPPAIPYRDGNGVRLNKFVSLSEEDVRKLITKSKTTSCAYDPLPTRLIKDDINEMLPLLTHIINISLSTGVFPGQWKTALVVPLIKKTGLDLVPKNYRPISNLHYVSKLTKQAVVNQLCYHSECEFPLTPCQSAYRVGHSTETALAKVQSDILLNMDGQKITQLVPQGSFFIFTVFTWHLVIKPSGMAPTIAVTT